MFPTLFARVPHTPIATCLAPQQRCVGGGVTENQTPGAGSNQAPRQIGPNTGPADTVNEVRRYDDWTNDLAGASLGGNVDITIAAGSATGTWDVTITNTSGNSPYPFVLTPAAWAMHDGSTPLFEMGAPASTEVERIAEDGDASMMATLLSTASFVSESGVEGTGPIGPGESFTFTITPDATNRFLSLMSMVVPSNDAFIAFEPGGVEIFDSAGMPRMATDIEADFDAKLFAWDAGTEMNQVGAAGPMQAPAQPGPNMGPPKATAWCVPSTMRSGATHRWTSSSSSP